MGEGQGAELTIVDKDQCVCNRVQYITMNGSLFVQTPSPAVFTSRTGT